MTPLAPRIVETGNYPCIDVVQGDVRVPETLQEIERLLDGHKADLIVADLLANPHDLSQRDTRYSRCVCVCSHHHFLSLSIRGLYSKEY